MYAVIQKRNAALLATQDGSDDMEVDEDIEARFTADEEVEDNLDIDPEDNDTQVELEVDELIDDEMEEMGRGTILSRQPSRDHVGAATELLLSVE